MPRTFATYKLRFSTVSGVGVIGNDIPSAQLSPIDDSIFMAKVEQLFAGRICNYSKVLYQMPDSEKDALPIHPSSGVGAPHKGVMFKSFSATHIDSNGFRRNLRGYLAGLKPDVTDADVIAYVTDNVRFGDNQPPDIVYIGGSRKGVKNSR